MDFTVNTYEELLLSLMDKNYTFKTFEEFVKFQGERTVVLRHDVDLLPHNSLTFAHIQSDLGIKGTYYFRAVPESWDKEIILEISSLGHEIGYHYECLTTTGGDFERGIQDFEKNLDKLRALVPVSTICMHGSPMSKYDSKDLWNDYKYQDYGIIAEPYFDVDYNTVFYITDTGRKWDGNNVSVRDRVQTNMKHSYRTTFDIMATIESNCFPKKVMFTFHPQRWSNNMVLWSKELVLQNVKNVVKKHFFVKA
ncbi:hypothetical protein [Maribacter sp. 2307UL18-2]|uniref:hypothetical protein n=1 Tax=Maribacter sp. 2307UL18-2 TaxID=3386274 RepID=UPI0039BD7555